MTTMNAFWRDNNDLYSITPGYDEMIDAIKACDLPARFKYAVLAKMSSNDSFRDEANHFVRETILRVLEEAGRPMRVSELTYGDCENRIKNPDAPLYQYTTQRVTAQMRFLMCAGLVKRTEVKTGRTIEVKPGKFVEEIIAYFEIGA